MSVPVDTEARTRPMRAMRIVCFMSPLIRGRSPVWVGRPGVPAGCALTIGGALRYLHRIEESLTVN